MIATTISGIELRLETSKSVFSPRAIDAGTLAMLSVVRPCASRDETRNETVFQP